MTTHPELKQEATGLVFGVRTRRSSLLADSCASSRNRTEGQATGTTFAADAYGIVAQVPASGLRW